MIQIEVPDNPNGPGCEQTAFNEMDDVIRPLHRIVVTTASGDALCEAASVNADGSFGPAWVRRIDDSGEGPAYLVFGGDWGIRLRRMDGGGPWDLADRSQWGEPFKVYGIGPDVIF